MAAIPPFATATGRYEVMRRRWKYAPPPWVMYEALVDDHRRWLLAEPGEPSPILGASRRPDSVVFEPWLDPAVSALELSIAPDELGSAITVIAFADCNGLDDDARPRVRHRLGVCFGAALRDWVDVPH